MKSLLWLSTLTLTLTSCSIYQSYGRKSFEELSTSATLNEQLQVQLLSCTEFKDQQLKSNLGQESPSIDQQISTTNQLEFQSQNQFNQILISESETDMLYEQNMDEFVLIHKNLNDSCLFTANSQAIHQFTTNDFSYTIMEHFIRRRTQHFQEITK